MQKKLLRTTMICAGLLISSPLCWTTAGYAMMTHEDIEKESVNIQLCKRGLLRGDGHQRQSLATGLGPCTRCNYLQSVINKNKTY